LLNKISISLVVFAFGTSSLMAQSRAQEGAVAGGIAGAILGGVAGHQNDETPEGIAIGGALGALAGGLMGKAQDERMMQEYQYQEARRREVSQAVSIADAINMSRSGLAPSVIANQIRNSGVQQKIGVQEIIMLHENGVSELVIQEMQQARIAGTNPPVVYAPAPAVVVERRPQIIVESYPLRPYPRYVPPARYGFHYHSGPHRW
jgi:uncharacterized protein YcfJ